MYNIYIYCIYIYVHSTCTKICHCGKPNAPFFLPVIGLCSVCALRGEANLSLAEGSPTTRRGKWTWGASELLRHGGYGRHFLGSVYKIIYLHIYTYVYIYLYLVGGLEHEFYDFHIFQRG